MFACRESELSIFIYRYENPVERNKETSARRNNQGYKTNGPLSMSLKQAHPSDLGYLISQSCWEDHMR